MAEVFFVPDTSERNNRITQNDIDKGYLRLSINNKKYFPDHDCDVRVITGDVEHTCPLRIGNSDGKERSYKLYIGKGLMKILNIRPSSILEFNKLGDSEFIIIA